MEIYSHHNLPAISGVRTDAVVPREPRPRQPQAVPAPDPAPDRLSSYGRDQANRRPPLFMQPMHDVKLSRTGEQAMRTYHDVAIAGDREELVNRINELA